MRRFVRRLGTWNAYRLGTLDDRAFRCREAIPEKRNADSALSLYLVTSEIEHDDFESFCKCFITPDGDTPGACCITEDILISNGLAPVKDEEDESPYRHLHYVIECPSREVANILALAASSSVVRPFITRKGKMWDLAEA